MASSPQSTAAIAASVSSRVSSPIVPSLRDNRYRATSAVAMLDGARSGNDDAKLAISDNVSGPSLHTGSVRGSKRFSN